MMHSITRSKLERRGGKKERVVHPTRGLYVLLEMVVLAIAIQVVLECLSHRSLIRGLMTIITNPLMFISGSFIIGCFLSLSLLFPKRYLGYIIFSVLWLWLGFTNFILLSHRTTPLTATDFKMLSSVFTVINRYLNPIQMILVAVLAVCIVIGIIAFSRKLPPYTQYRIKVVVTSIVLAYLLTYGSLSVSFVTNAVSTNFGNIANAFLDYGFAYSFSVSVVDKGIKRPKDYSGEKINNLLEALMSEESTSNVSTVHASDAVFVPAPPLLPSESQNIDYLDIGFTNSIIAKSDEVIISGGTDLSEEIIRPNIVFVQLESYFDVKRLKAFEYNTDPIPNMTMLMENYTSGYVTVPSIGAGTANTEFEIVSGMSLDYFGAGEYPYKSILRERTVESVAYTLGELGYHNHAIHNNMGTFYARAYVYPRFGFDSFSSIEYMNDIEYTPPLGWAKDAILVEEVTKAINYTEEEDFVFAVSVQPHGKYPEEEILENPVIVPHIVDYIPDMNNQDLEDYQSEDTLSQKVSKAEEERLTLEVSPTIDSSPTPPELGITEGLVMTEESSMDVFEIPFILENGEGRESSVINEVTDVGINIVENAEIEEGIRMEIEEDFSLLDRATYNKYLYFINQVYETDQFIGDLVEAVEAIDEPTVIVFYGDHFPTLDITDDDLRDGSPFQMEYVIWDNIGLEKEDEDLMAYQLSAKVLDMIDYSNGILNRFHQTRKLESDYEAQLELLQYDMLYGDMNIYGGDNPHKRIKMTFGVEPIEIINVKQQGETILIEGNNFTLWSEVFIGKEQQETLFLDSNTLIVPLKKILRMV